MQKINSSLIIWIALLCLITACTTIYTPTKVVVTDLGSLENAEAETTGAAPVLATGELRRKALEDTAMSVAAQGGLAWSSEEIDKRLTKDRSNLDTIFNFNGMMLSHGVIPPILVEGDNTLNLNDPTTIRISDRTYKIVEQARFATTPPQWHDYLWMSYARPEFPHKVLLPRNDDERIIWRRAIRLGWQKGIEQSYSIFQQNLARLKRDYQGMILYRKLLQQHMVSPPFVAKTSLGVTGDGTVMHVNDQVLRISELPQLQTDTSGWKAIVVKDNVQ